MSSIHAQILVDRNRARVTYNDNSVLVEIRDSFSPDWLCIGQGKTFIEAVMRAAETANWKIVG